MIVFPTQLWARAHGQAKDEADMKRRNMLRVLTTIPAASLVSAQQPVVPPKPTAVVIEETPIIEATPPDRAGQMVPSFFSAAQMAALQRLSDLIVPPMDGVPGALAASAPEFLDFLIGNSPHDRQTLYRRGLDELNTLSERNFQISFARTNQSQADGLLAPLRERWTDRADEFTTFLQTVKLDVLQATEGSEEWVRVMSKRVRRASGVGTYWFPVG